MDQEEVARLVSKYNLLAIPVVDSLGKLVGIVTVDDVIDVIREEATEDFLKLAGTAEEELLNKSIFTIARARLPWLVATLFGGIVACHLMKTFQLTLEKVIALAFFVPVIMGMGGNIGIQSTALMVRGLATGNVDLAHIGKALFREIKVGVIMGTSCGLAIGLAAYLITGRYVLGVVVSTAMLCAITVAATIGTPMPLLFKKVGIDPAIASGPFVTTTNDITGLSIYFLLANWLFKVFGKFSINRQGKMSGF